MTNFMFVEQLDPSLLQSKVVTYSMFVGQLMRHHNFRVAVAVSCVQVSRRLRFTPSWTAHTVGWTSA